MTQDFPIFDGVAPSWADLSAKASMLGAPLFEAKDIQSVSTGTEVSIGTQRGVGSLIRRRTTGSVVYTGSLTFYRTGWEQAARTLAVLAPRRGLTARISLVHFDLTYQWTPPNDFAIYETRLKGCRIVGRDANDSEGDDPLVVDVALSIAEIVDFDLNTGQEIALL